MHAVTSLDEDRAGAADLARIARGQWGIESVHWLRHGIHGRREHRYAGTARRSWPRCRNLAVSLLHLASVIQITRTLQAIGRDRTRVLNYPPL